MVVVVGVVVEVNKQQRSGKSKRRGNAKRNQERKKGKGNWMHANWAEMRKLNQEYKVSRWE